MMLNLFWSRDTMFKSVLALFVFGASYVLAGPLSAANDQVCEGQVTNGETFIGANKDVKVEFVTCPQAQTIGSFSNESGLTTRQTPPTNVCGANCSTNCFTPSGGGPDPNDCHVISDALLFDSENVGALFSIGTGTNNTVVMTFRTCKSFFVNQDFGNLAYCRTDWAAVLNFVAFNCQATQNAHGGNCVATDQRWFIQAQHS